MTKEFINGFIALGIMGGSLCLIVFHGAHYKAIDVERELWGVPGRYVIPISSWDIYEDSVDVVTPERRLQRDHEKKE